MIGKAKLLVIPVITVLLLSLSLSLVGAQYTTSQTTNVVINSNGTFTGSASNVGVSYDIQGTPGATGTVTVDSYSGNPQPTASIPSGDSLNDFVVIAFNMNAPDFSLATVTISYSSVDVQNLHSPYAVFKYVAASNSYVKLLSTVDPNAQTITVTLNSINDPVLAIGGATTASAGISGALWVVLIVIPIVVVLVAVFIVSRRRPKYKVQVMDTGSSHPTSEQNVNFLPKAQSSNINVEDKPQTVIPTDQKIENQETESGYSPTTKSLNLPQEPQPPKVNVEEKQQTSTTEQNVDISPKETPEPQPLNINAQNEPQTATPNNTEVKPPNINAEKTTQRAASRKRRNRKKTRNKQQKQTGT
jgi:hypothetical protein